MMHVLFLMLWFKGTSDLEVTLPSENAQTFFIYFCLFYLQIPRCTLIQFCRSGFD